MQLDVPQDWRGLADRLEQEDWRRLIVLGAADSGKSSFCAYLGERLPRLALLDADPGQKMVGPPACVTLGDWSAGSLRLGRMRFVGDLHPVGHAPTIIAAVARLAQTPGLERLVVNTTGLVTGPGIALKRAKIDAVDPDLVVALERAGELEPILSPLARRRVQRLLPSSAAQRKRSGRRKAAREARLIRALETVRQEHLPGAVIEELLRFPPPPGALRLCCGATPDGEDRALGLVKLDRFEQERNAWLAGPAGAIHRIRVGIAVPQAVAEAILPRLD